MGPPSGDWRYTLVRLACTLHPLAERLTRYAEAILRASLRPRLGPGTVLAYDLYPQRLTADIKGTYTIGLSPELKFGPVAASVLEVGAEIEFRKVVPVIQGYGLGESSPYWQFTPHSSYPLLGCQSVYLVLAVPADAGGAQLDLEMLATVEDRFGPVRLGLPEEVRTQISRTIEV
jgi:hypothetical protein